MNENTRFIEALEFLKNTGKAVSYVDIANSLHTNKAAISDIKAGRKKVSFELLNSMNISYPSINIEWIVTGEGSMLRKLEIQSTIAALETISSAVPFYDLPVSAGALGVLDYSKSTGSPDGYIDIEVFHGCDAILPVIGVSMEPEIRSGDLIGIKKLDGFNWDFLQTGRVYMIITHEERMIKYIKKADNTNYIVCSSPNCSDFKVLKDDVIEIHRVIASVKSF